LPSVGLTRDDALRIAIEGSSGRTCQSALHDPPELHTRTPDATMSITISTAVDIDAPKLAWDVLTEFAAYHEWNPYSTIEGTAQVGTKLTVHMGTSGGRGMAFKPTLLAATGLLRWLDRA
jgi:hypothetical protein